MEFSFSNNVEFNLNSQDISDLTIKFKNHERFDFVNQLKNQHLLDSCLAVYTKFKNKKNFAQIGIGGSSLGPEMLISALKNNETNFVFFNNVDADDVARKTSKLELTDTLFYVVSKSGGTAETMATFAIVANKLMASGIAEENLKEHFVFATDPKESTLLDLGRELGITCLEVPTFVGGRFSVLTPVGILPALFAGIDINTLLSSAYDYAHELCSSDNFEKAVNGILSMYEKGYNETVLMPYSSLLRDLSFWFVQLWAESLGKKDSNGKRVGFTPLPSYGATDQHSQVQLFMEGPLNKLMMLIHVSETKNDFPLKNNFNHSRLKKLSPYSLKNLMDAEYFGTKKAFDDQEIPYIEFKIDAVNEKNIGQLIVFFELLTSISGQAMKIDPFNQPGVEAGKIYTFEWLDKL